MADRFRITAILAVHIGTIGAGSWFLVVKSFIFGGVYDTWASGGGDIRLLKESVVTLNPLVLLRYLIKSPFGAEGWIFSVNSLEDIVVGLFLLGSILDSSGNIVSLLKNYVSIYFET